MCSLRLAGRSRGLVSIHPRRRRIPRPAPAHTAIVSRSHSRDTPEKAMSCVLAAVPSSDRASTRGRCRGAASL